MYSAKYKPDCFKGFPLHRAAASGSLAKCEQLLSDGANPYQPTPDGLTALHAAIANKAEPVVDLLLDRYEQDWTIVRQTIKHQFLWKAEQTSWKNRPILIAWTEEECAAAITVASSCPAGIPLNLQMFVLLQTPNYGHRFIALDVCNRSKWFDIIRLICRLLANGVLSLDRSSMRLEVENYLQVACALSTKEIVVKLISRGASLNVASGMQDRTPFMAAGERMRKDVMDLLMTKYVDRFDPCACDRSNLTALHLIMSRQHTAMTEWMINCLLNYRTSKLRESKSVALSRLFTFESPDCKSQNVWSFVRSNAMKKLSEKYIRLCEMDVRTPLHDTTTLAVLIGREIALTYCFEQIEQNLELLQLQESYNHFNILHVLIRHKQLSFVEALYQKHGAFVKEMFEVVETAYDLLRILIYNKEEHGLSFVFKHHRDFYTKDMDKLRQIVITHLDGTNPSHGNLFEIIKEAVPELREDVDTLKQSKNSQENDFYEDLRQLRDHFTKTLTRLETNGKRLDDYLDQNRRTFLHGAVSWGAKDLVAKLLAHNMDVMKLDANGCLPIHLVYRHESMFLLLLSKNESAQLAYVKPNSGYNLLHISCRNGLHGEALKQLIDYGMDVNGPTSDGELPLSLAACCATVTFLLENGARIDLLNEDLLSRNLNYMHNCAAIALIPRLTHLPWFRKCAHLYLVWMIDTQSRYFFSYSNQEFLEEHPNIRRLLFDSLYEHSKEKMAEVFSRVCHNSIPCCVRWFMEYDYDIDYDHQYWDQSTPLLALFSYIECDINEQVAMIEKLLQKSIDVNAANSMGRTALITLANGWRRHCDHLKPGLASLLLRRGAKVDQQDDQGNTALHHAFESEQWEMVEFLIENGANVSLKNNAGKRACEMGTAMKRSLFGFVN
ncbi:uncharacterized protein LOC126560872 [Anopheles maculipalpis]|uniref:uncharacterized protein LOC126560872 n=1 Tax=Anopheles maculipalpis TaxID=1496333 RepID=UPI002159B51B|nr:uncharacterized protein LOC126560872 [Anopheles maculipalpis]